MIFHDGCHRGSSLLVQAGRAVCPPGGAMSKVDGGRGRRSGCLNAFSGWCGEGFAQHISPTLNKSVVYQHFKGNDGHSGGRQDSGSSVSRSPSDIVVHQKSRCQRRCSPGPVRHGDFVEKCGPCHVACVGRHGVGNRHTCYLGSRMGVCHRNWVLRVSPGRACVPLRHKSVRWIVVIVASFLTIVTSARGRRFERNRALLTPWLFRLLLLP